MKDEEPRAGTARGVMVALVGAGTLAVVAIGGARLLSPAATASTAEAPPDGSASSPVAVDESTPAGRAYQAARAALLRAAEHDINDAWVVSVLLRSGADRELAQLQQRAAQAATSNPLGRLVNPAVPAPTILPHAQGLERMRMIWSTPFAVPRDQATALAAEFLAEPHEGYMLTHQITLYEWFEEQGRVLPPEALALRPALERKLLEEQRAKQGELFHDLYVERVAFLLAFTDVSLEQARPWIDRIVELQRPDGTWGQFMWDVEYQGDRHTVVDDGRHTLLLGMLALRSYLDRMAQAGG